MAEHPRDDGGDRNDSAPPAPAARRPFGLYGLLAVAVIAVGLGLILFAVLAAKPPATRVAADPNAAAYASLGGPFEATDQTGRRVDQGVLKGRWSAVFFGYVTCPDICPATLQALAQTQALLGPDAQRFQVVFATVDAQRDTPELMKTYLEQEGYPPHALGLTGSVAQMERLAKSYRIYAALIPRGAKDGGGYDVSHTGAIYLVNPRGVTVGTLTEAMGPQAMADQVRRTMHGG